jgi:hypothetical protein
LSRHLAIGEWFDGGPRTFVCRDAEYSRSSGALGDGTSCQQEFGAFAVAGELPGCADRFVLGEEIEQPS